MKHFQSNYNSSLPRRSPGNIPDITTNSRTWTGKLPEFYSACNFRWKLMFRLRVWVQRRLAYNMVSTSMRKWARKNCSHLNKFKLENSFYEQEYNLGWKMVWVFFHLSFCVRIIRIISHETAEKSARKSHNLWDIFIKSRRRDPFVADLKLFMAKSWYFNVQKGRLRGKI